MRPWVLPKYGMITRLTEAAGITHLEDLPIQAFIDTVRDLPGMTAQEKLDGANLWVGLDEEGRLFTSREGKRPGTDRRYAVTDWPMVASLDQFRAAHAALATKEVDLKRVLRPGDTVEAEVLFGRQPNSVTYGANGRSYLAFLRGVNGTPDTVATHLSTTLRNQEVEVEVTTLDTSDGEALEERAGPVRFQFTAPHQVDPAQLRSAGLEGHVRRLERFLGRPSAVHGLSNMELLTLSLTSVPKEDRAVAKQARAELQARVTADFKLPIKQDLLDKVVRRIRPGLRDEQAKGPDIGIEGIVLRRPSGEQVKVVDKDVFGVINQFNQAPRQAVQGALSTTDPSASLEARGGLLGAMRIRIAEALGNRELAKPASLRKVLEPVKGADPAATLKGLAASMTEVNRDHVALKRKVLAIIAETAATLKAELAGFNEHHAEYRLKLKTGQELGLSPEVVKRTLLTFAEAKRSLQRLFDQVKRTRSLVQLLAALYGPVVTAMHQAQGLDEGQLLEVRGEIDQAEYEHRTLPQVIGAYLATALMATLVFHEHDLPGMRRLRDRKNMGLRRWSHDMSPLNHWGYLVWSNGKADLKKRVTRPVLAALADATRHIRRLDWRLLHMDLSYNKDLEVEWPRHQATLQRLLDLSGQRSDRLNTLLERVMRWPTLTLDERARVLEQLYLLAMQHGLARSSLFARLRVLQQNTLLNANGTNSQMVIENLLSEVVALAEDGEGDFTGQPVATTSAAIATVPLAVGQRVTVRRKRNPMVKRLMMKFSDTRKSTDEAA